MEVIWNRPICDLTFTRLCVHLHKSTITSSQDKKFAEIDALPQEMAFIGRNKSFNHIKQHILMFHWFVATGFSFIINNLAVNYTLKLLSCFKELYFYNKVLQLLLFLQRPKSGLHKTCDALAQLLISTVAASRGRCDSKRSSVRFTGVPDLSCLFCIIFTKRIHILALSEVNASGLCAPMLVSVQFLFICIALFKIHIVSKQLCKDTALQQKIRNGFSFHELKLIQWIIYSPSYCASIKKDTSFPMCFQYISVVSQQRSGQDLWERTQM